jgi:hypothetical protein
MLGPLLTASDDRAILAQDLLKRASFPPIREEKELDAEKHQDLPARRAS